MGGSSYSDHVYTARVTTAKAAGADLFAHDADIRTGKTAMKVHEKLDPARKNAVGKIIRESFDSDVHPDSRAVAVLFDVTGSMSTVPRLLVSRLDKLMASLVKKGLLAHPHVLFGAIGDATCDKVPLQVGQFEGGNEMDDALTNIVLESGGGGQNTESYELGMYFMARHTDIHCFTKRGQKGYLFLTGDERPYPQVKAREVKKFIGADIGEDIPVEAMLAELREKYEVFWLMPGGTNHWGDPNVEDYLSKLMGQSFIKLPNPEDIVETICSIIGLGEGFDMDEIGKALKDVGASADSVDRSYKALAVYAGTKAVTKGAKITGGSLVEGKGKKVARL